MGELGKERKREHVEVPEQLPERREIAVPEEAPATPEKVPVRTPS
jgi:hypothetical protein